MVIRKRREDSVYTYQCTITGQSYKTTKKASNPEELVSVKAYYELHPDKDDRPERVKKEIQLKEEIEASRAAMSAEAADEGPDAKKNE